MSLPLTKVVPWLLSLLLAVMVILPLMEPTVLPMAPRVRSFRVLFWVWLPMVKPRPPPLKRPDFLVFL